jgi:23S rRNA pseudouridine1911/1915/1917 synthase
VGQEFARPGVVHRLDRDTTGVIVFAKDEEAHWRLGSQFENRQVDKRYLALVEGVVEADVDVLDEPIGPHQSKAKGLREKQSVRHDHLGKSAVTICRVRERFDHHTLVELELKTGRTHQIRVHLSFHGHPIVGDDMYGGHVLRKAHIEHKGDETMVLDRQALHATTLGFTHPITKAAARFTAPVPEDFARAMALLREHSSRSGVLTPPGATIDIDQAVPRVM